MAALLVLLLSLAGVCAGSPMPGEHATRRLSVERRLDTISAPSPAPTPAASAASRVFHVTDYGADPTGTADSTAAIMSAISAAFRPRTTRTLMPGIPDLGGAEIHLDGGEYLISSPIALPASGGGNLKIHAGSLVASGDFPTDRYLIELWARPSPSSRDYDYEYVTLRDLMLDASYRSGGIAVVDSLRTTIDNCYIIHFQTDGIWVKSGHETLIRGSYIGQHVTAGADRGERNFTGVGINLAGNDNAVTDVVLFSSAVGVLVAGQANVITGAHCYNKASGFGGVGIYVKPPGKSQTRIVSCYLDFTDVVAEDPDQLHVSSSFFLGSGRVVLRAVRGVARGVEIVGNMFSGNGGDIVALDEAAAAFATVEQVRVVGNAADGMAVRATAATAAVEGNGSEWSVDFSPTLLFRDRIEHVQYTLVSEGSGFPRHALRNVSGNRVVVESEVPVSATVHVAVDQSVGWL